MKRHVVDRVLCFLLVTFIITISTSKDVLVPGASENEPALSEEVDFNGILGSIDHSAIFEHLEYFASIGSRMSGYTGCDAAAEYIYNYFERVARLQNVSYDYFNVTIPLNYGVSFSLVNNTQAGFRIFALEPNFACPVAAKGLTGPLIYVGSGELEELCGNPVRDAVVLMDYGSMDNWLRVASLGAEAVIFVAGDRFTTRSDDLLKSTTWAHAPLSFNFPRFYMPHEDFVRLREIMLSVRPGLLFVNITARTMWARPETKNVLGVVEGDKLEDRVIVLSAHYDSYSPVLSWAPGANDAVGIATLLELARLLNLPEYKPKYTVLFVAFSGHHQILEGARQFFVKYFLTSPYRSEIGDRIMMQINVQISSLSKAVGTTNIGQYGAGQGERITRFEDLDAYVTGGLLKTIRDQTGKDYTLLSVCSRERHDYNLRMPVPKMDDAEIFQVNYGVGYGIESIDYDVYAYSPADTLDKIDVENLRHNVELAVCISYGLTHTENLPVSQFVPVETSESVGGTVATYNVTTDWYDPVPNALVLTFFDGHPRPRAAFTGKDGRFVVYLKRIYMIKQLNSRLYPFVVNSTTGNVEYARTDGMHQWGQYGNRYCCTPLDYHRHHGVDNPYDLGFVAVFKCATVTLFDVIFPFDLGAEDIPVQVSALTLDTKTTPEDFGVTKSTGLAVLHVPPEKPFIFLLKSPIDLYPLGVLANTTKDNLDGYGYTLRAGELLMFDKTAVRMVRDLQNIRTPSIDMLLSSDIAITEILNLREYAETLMEKAESTYDNLSYTESHYLRIKAWATGRKAYEKIRQIFIDTINVVPFFALLLFPFVFLFERLVFNLQSGRKRLLMLVGMFFVLMFVFSYMNPGFKMASHPTMLLVASLVLILLLPVLFTFFTYVSKSLKKKRLEISGLHVVEIGRLRAAISSFYIGIQNMRKRRLRSVLLLITLIIVVLGIVLFSSLQSITIVKVATKVSEPPYEGILIWNEKWAPLGDSLVEFMSAAYGDKAHIDKIAWLYSRSPSQVPTVYTNITHGERSYGVYAFVGMSTEHEPFWAQANLAGRWFVPKEMDSCILTDICSDALNVSVKDHIHVLDRDLIVAGIVSSAYLDQVTYINGESFTPEDQRTYEQGDHVLSREIIIIPYKLALLYGGDPRSLNIVPKNSVLVDKIAEDIFETGRYLNYVSGVENRIRHYRLATTYSIFGWQLQIVPVALAAVMILNILLGSVKEREKDILTYSSVGLSPFHLAFMFLAESMIYAVVGGILGYIVSMSILHLMPAFGLVTPMNYSSTFVITSLGVTMLMVIAAAVYPAIKASKMITPSLKRAWEIPTRPKGNLWEIPIPIVITDEKDASDLCNFLAEFLIRQTGEVGKFMTKNLELKEETNIREIEFDTRLAPYEYGVEQNVRIYIKKDVTENRWNVAVALRRASGEVSVWTHRVRGFIDIIRKQFLLWRTMSDSEKEKYIQK